MLLELDWRPVAIAKQEHVNPVTVYRYQDSLRRHGSSHYHPMGMRGCFRLISVGAGNGLLEHLGACPWLYLDEMREFPQGRIRHRV